MAIQLGALSNNEWLSDKLNHPVTLWPLLLPTGWTIIARRARYRRFEQELIAVFGRLPHEPLPDLVIEELLEFESPPGTYFDAFPISASQQSLATMDQRKGES